MTKDPVKNKQTKEILQRMKDSKDFGLYVMQAFISDVMPAPERALLMTFNKDMYAKEYLDDALELYVYENIEEFV